MGRTPVFIATLSLFFVSQTPVATAQDMSRLLHLASSLELLPALPEVSRPRTNIYPMLVVRIRSGNLGTPAQANRRRWPPKELIWTAGAAFAFPLPPAAFLRAFQVNGSVDASTATEESDSESTAGIIREALICLFVPAKESDLVPMNTELDFVYAVFCLWSAAFSLFFTDIYNFNAGISGLPFLVNPAFDCDFPGLLQAAAECMDGSQGFSSLKVGLIARTFVPPLFGRAFFVNRGLGPGSSLAGAVKVELHAEEAVPT
ncbi:hypothetical protein IW262DRAFT_1300226 [Armillaria fumosa]|nr:hypothetical protein IW262DRAFT_1300226 [Armillaria fumosa]